MMKHLFLSLRISRILCITLPFLVLACLPNCPAKAADQNGENQSGENERQYVTIDFNDVDINVFIKYISELTGNNFIVDRTVKGKVTIISPTRMTVKDAYRVFESVLEVHGYATVPSGPVTKIIPAVQARSKSIPTVMEGEQTVAEDKVVTRIIPMKTRNGQ